MFRSRLLFSAGLLFTVRSLGVHAQCAAGAWLTLAPMKEPRQEMAVAQLDGKLYAVGGLAGRANANEIYDAATDTWSTGADFPTSTDHDWAVSLDGRVYVGGGSSNRVFFYDPTLSTWTEISPSANVHGGTPVAAVIGGRIYVAGGTGGAMLGNELEMYEPSSNRWTTLAPMSCARNHTAGGVIGGQLYVAGGRPGSQTCLEVYDPATNGWTRKTPMPTGRSGMAGAVVANCLYIFGGEGNPGDPNGIFHQVEAYDPSSDIWIQLPPMQTGRHGIYASVIGNVVYLPGGATHEGFGVTAINEAYVVGSLPRQKVILAPRRKRD